MSALNATASSSKQKKDKSNDKHNKEKHHSDKSKSKKDKKSKGEKHEKGEKSPFEHREMRMRLSVPPKFAGDVMAGVRDQLDGMIMQYLPEVKGVLIAHWDHSFDDDTAKIINECPFEVVNVEFHAIYWAPKIGQKLRGIHSISSPSHLSLIFAGAFNVSIPIQHIPADLFEFEETDEVVATKSDDGSEVEYIDKSEMEMEETGRWRNKETGEFFGKRELVKFTVIGMQVTNQMLSLTGSLLEDPSNPPPAPEIVAAPIMPSPSPSPEAQQPHPAKKARTQPQPQTKQVVKDEVDTSKMTARELKAYRKEEEKKKRDARKARKEGRAEDDAEGEEQEEGGAGTKRKADEQESEKRKKKKE
ncbi:DNA-directed RNA polymerase I subunit RPA43 [Cryptococcus deuterogattii 2001/935-1]|nr:DNA-directed RNA polymerase I subunit RPA43 [Cryptococcus deuterogattii MMRL2647]KIR98084.1 DNA-directed RNA polymerase I subunit RPA43 [Cryptococcus deuterogattii 2001/935-1]